MRIGAALGRKSVIASVQPEKWNGENRYEVGVVLSWCLSTDALVCPNEAAAIRVEGFVPLIGHRQLNGTVLLAQSPTNIRLILAHSKIF